MKFGMKKEIEVDAKVLSLHMKVCDQFCARLKDAEGSTLKDYEGYVPGFMPGEHYGDYLILDIDVDTGQILNWKKPDAEDLQKFVSGDEEE